jgi:RNA polymerase sigma-70 factor (ECF subfamily)
MAQTFPDGTWQSWFEVYGRRLRLFARQWASGSADADDIVQEAFVRFWRSSVRNDADAHVQLFAMVRRAGLDAIRRATRRSARERTVVESHEEAQWFTPSDDPAGREAEIQSALASLPPEQREVIVLKIWGELTFDQIARSLEISPNTAASRYRYALEALRRNPALALARGGKSANTTATP